MRNLSLFRKLMLANVLYAIPVLALIYMMVKAQNVNIDFAELELVGNSAQSEAMDYYGDLLRAKFQPDPTEMIANARLSFVDVEKMMLDHSEDLQLSDSDLAKRQREAVSATKIRSLLTESDAGSSAKLDALIANARTLITHLGDTSNLILDPDLDSYYLMDATLVAFPQLQNRFTDLQTLILQIKTEMTARQAAIDADEARLQADIAKLVPFVRISEKKKSKRAIASDKKAVSVEPAFEKTKLTKIPADKLLNLAQVAWALKNSDSDRITADLQTTINEDFNFNGVQETLKSRLQPNIAALAKDIDELISSVNQASLTASVDNLESISKKSAELLDQSFISWKMAKEELDQLLSTRTRILKSERLKSLLAALLALAFAVFVLLWISDSFAANMGSVLKQLRQVVERSQRSGQDLTSLSDELSSSSAEQASAIRQTAASLHEIEAMVNQTLGSISKTKTDSLVGAQRADETLIGIQRLTTAISDIAGSNVQVMQQMESNRKDLVDVSRLIGDIGEKTKVINDIVFQTRILSFNASVEAARAGEHGKGFSIVAEEVGNLAKMSGLASSDIQQMLNTSVDSVTATSAKSAEGVAKLIEFAKQKIDMGQNLTADFAKSVEQLADRVRQIQQSSEGVFSAAQEQTKGVGEISQALGRLESMAGENMKRSSQMSENSKNLHEQSENLSVVADKIEKTVMGKLRAKILPDRQL